jgi:hypothetical protein
MIALLRRMAPAAALLVLVGCGPRVLIATGTTLGLKATPGDGQSRPPQVTLGYKRAEAALVPTDGSTAKKGEDAYSVLAVFDFRSQWFGKTELASFIGSGNAARDVQDDEQFVEAFAAATVAPVADTIQERRRALVRRLGVATDDDLMGILSRVQRPVPPGKTPREALHDHIARITSGADLAVFESAFGQLGR